MTTRTVTLLRAARLRRGLTQQQLGAQSGLPQQTISRLESGADQSPEWRTVFAICRALRAKPESVFPVGDVIAAADVPGQRTVSA